jgi:tetratricopeptide (TPR) repeat protein/tRNA A-37 threonylcarbamoyl transferase component Bud32
LPGYTLRRQIGRGGFGVVYLAQQVLTERVVAVKLLHAGAAGDLQTERFEREAAVLARLDHPNVVRVLAGGKSEDGRLFLALEYVEGGGLDTYLRKLPQPPQAAAHLVETLAQAVHYLHGQGIIHRDLKPSNILLVSGRVVSGEWSEDSPLTTHHSPLTPKITDFGLAKYQDAGHSLTATGGILGTPSYMAPEQASGHGKEVGPAADVYALGAILYEALTGRPPFLGATPLDTLRQVLNEEPVPPTRLQPTVPRALEVVCLKCLEKKPERRYASAADLAADVRRHLEGQPVAARRAGPVARLGRWCRRHPGVATLAAAGVLALAGLIAYLWQAAQVAEARAAGAVAERRSQEARARALGETLRGQGATAEALLLKARYATSRPDQQEEAFRAIREFSGLRAEAERTAEGLRQLGGSAELLARHDRARWQEWADRLRAEASLWLTRARLQRTRVVSLPERPAVSRGRQGDFPLVALSPDGKQLAVVYPGATKVLLLDPDGKVQDRLPIPEQFGRPAVVKGVVKGDGRQVEILQQIAVATSRLTYPGPNRLEYQVGSEMLSWDLARGKQPRYRSLPEHQPPWLHGSAENASSARFFAMIAEEGTVVSVRRRARGARPAVVWRAGAGERATRIAFGGDRALFILSDRRLTVIDAAGGSAAEVLRDDANQVEVGHMLPWAGGVVLLQRRGSVKETEGPQLVFWSAALPEGQVQALHHEEPPRCLSLDGTGPRELTLLGTPDHLVQAWGGPAPLWQAGIPYLGEQVGKVSPRLRMAGAEIPFDTTDFIRRFRMIPLPGRATPRFEITDELLKPHPPYRWWGFTPGGALVVERHAPAANGQSGVRTEVYGADGLLKDAYPPTGKGRILATSPDRRLAVVVADENETLLTLEVWSLPERRRLGTLGRYARPATRGPRAKREPIEATLLTSPTRKDYLLLARSYPPGAGRGAELEIWRVGAGVERLGHLSLPKVYTAAFLTPAEDRAIVWRPRSVPTGPYFARVIDLATATRVCDLEDFAATGNLNQSLLTASRFVATGPQGLSDDPNDPSRTHFWDLRTGRQTSLDTPPWRAVEPPMMTLGPDRTRIVFFGRLHDTGDGLALMYDLEQGRLLWRSPPLGGRPRVVAVLAEVCVLEVQDRPVRAKPSLIRVRWSDGRQLMGPGPAAARAIAVHEDVRGCIAWRLWADADGLTLQNGTRGDRQSRLASTASGLRNVLWPPLEEGTLALRLESGAGLWDADTGRQIVRFPQEHHCLGFDAAHRWAMTIAPATGELRIWNARTGTEAGRWQAAARGFDLTRAPCQLDPSGKRLAVQAHGLLQLWDLEADRRVLAVPAPGHLKPVDCVVQHAGAGLSASAGADGLVLLWQRDSGKLVRALPAHRQAVTALAFHPDGAHLASASAAGEVALHGPEGKTAWTIRLAPAARVTCLAFAAGGKALLLGTDDGRLVRLSARNGRLQSRQATGLGSVLTLALAPDGKVAAVGGTSGVQLRDPATLQRRTDWRRESPVSGLAFVGGGRLLAVAGKAVEFWDTQAGQRAVWALEVPHGPVRALAMNDGTGELAVADQGAAALIYDLPDLQKRLKELGLGLEGFPAARWPRSGSRSTDREANPAAWRELAEELVKRQQWLSLYWVCCTALKERADDARLWYLRGEAELRVTGKLRAALDAYSESLKLTPADWRTWLRRAEVYKRMRWLKEANDDYARAFEMGATGWEAWHSRAEVLDGLGQFGEALRHLDRALALNPDHHPSWRLRGLICADLGQWAEAEKALSRALELLPHDFTLHRWHAATLLGAGEPGRFREACARMLRRFAETSDPDTAARVVATCALVAGDVEVIQRCVTMAARAVEQEPGNRRCVSALGAALYRAGRYEEAARRLAEGPGLDPQSGVVLAMAWARLGKGKDAARQLAAVEQSVQRDEQKKAVPWHARVELAYLFREAAALLKSSPD